MTHVRQLVYWRDYAPEPDCETTRPSFDASRPRARIPRDKWDNLDGLVAAAKAKGVAVTLTLTGPVPRWATKGKRGNNYRPDRNSGVRGVRGGGRLGATAIGSRYLDGLERAQPAAVPQPAVPEGQAILAQALPRALPGGARQGLGATGNGSDKVLAGETSPAGQLQDRRPDHLRANLYFKGRKLKVDGYAHHPYTKKAGPFYKPGKTTT